jgi:hypothetical protein
MLCCPAHLFPNTPRTCQQYLNPSGETVPLILQKFFSWRLELKGLYGEEGREGPFYGFVLSSRTPSAYQKLTWIFLRLS